MTDRYYNLIETLGSMAETYQKDVADSMFETVYYDYEYDRKDLLHAALFFARSADESWLQLRYAYQMAYELLGLEWDPEEYYWEDAFADLYALSEDFVAENFETIKDANGNLVKVGDTVTYSFGSGLKTAAVTEIRPEAGQKGRVCVDIGSTGGLLLLDPERFVLYRRSL